MPAKKKAPVRAHKNKSNEEKTARGGVTTIDSSPKDGGNNTTIPSSSAPKIPPEKKAPASPARVEYPTRERRVSPEGRRGRFAEKTPPGTRTKMLKIIYDRKAEMANKRQNALIGKLIVAVVIAASLYYGAQHAIDLTTRSITAVVELLDMQSWWSNVATKTPAPKRQYLQQRTSQPVPSRQPSGAASVYRRPAVQKHSSSSYRHATLKQPIKRSYRRAPVQRKTPVRKLTYGQTAAYRGKTGRTGR